MGIKYQPMNISSYLCAMSFQTNIKLGNITNLSDARFAAAAGATYIGFCFDPMNEHYITPIKAKEIIDWVTGSSVVAEFGNQSLEEIRDISELLNVDVIEVNNTFLPDELLSLGKPIIKKVNVNVFTKEKLQHAITAYEKVADAFHVYADSETETYDCDQLVSLCQSHQLIWGLQLNTGNVLNILSSFKPFGINLVGGTEEKAGMKDFDELNDLFDVLRTED
jgi:phosphoribosylanthranilate isomerase